MTGWLGEQREHIGRADGCVLDAIARARTRGRERADRQDQLASRHAVERDRSSGVARGPDRDHQSIESGELALVENELQRAAFDGRVRRGREIRVAHHDEPLPELAGLDGAREGSKRLGGVRRGRVGQPGDAACREAPTDSRKARPTRIPELLAKPVVEPEEPSRRPPRRIAFDPGWTRVAFESEPLDAERVDDPERARALLNPQRAIRHPPIEPIAIEIPTDRLVVADAANPRVVPGDGRAAQRAPQRVEVGHLGWTAANRGVGRGEREEMQMVVVQTREQRATRCIERCLTGFASEIATDLGDAGIREPDVEWCPAFDLDARDQHRAEMVSCTAPAETRRSWWLE